MNRGVLQHAGKMARYMSRRMMLTAGVAALALLTYCGVQKGEDLDPVRDPPAIFPSDDPGTMALYNLAPDSQVVLQGATNISDWSSRSSQGALG